MLKQRTVLLALAASMALSTIAHAAPFMSPKGYSFTPAPGWTVNKTGMMGTDVICYIKAPGGFAPNFNVVVAPASPGETLQQGRAGVAALYPKMFPQFKMGKMAQETVGGAPALLVVGSYLRGTQRLSLRQDLVLRGGKVYTFTGTVPASMQARYSTAFALMTQSVRWSR